MYTYLHSCQVGLASGLDCSGEGLEAFFNLGFGFVELGPVGDAEALAERLWCRDSSGQIGQFGVLGALIEGGKEEPKLVGGVENGVESYATSSTKCGNKHKCGRQVA